MKRPPNRPIPIERMREFVALDSASRTGLRWIKYPGGSAKVNSEVGTDNGHGYFIFQFQGVIYKNSRVAYALYHGVDPSEMQVDHVNRNKQDNRIENLRLVTHRQNHQNKSNHGAYPVGVEYDKNTGKFRARIGIGGKIRHLGSFATPELASAAYNLKCSELEAATASQAQATTEGR